MVKKNNTLPILRDRGAEIIKKAKQNGIFEEIKGQKLAKIRENVNDSVNTAIKEHEIAESKYGQDLNKLIIR